MLELESPRNMMHIFFSKCVRLKIPNYCKGFHKIQWMRQKCASLKLWALMKLWWTDSKHKQRQQLGSLKVPLGIKRSNNINADFFPYLKFLSSVVPLIYHQSLSYLHSLLCCCCFDSFIAECRWLVEMFRKEVIWNIGRRNWRPGFALLPLRTQLAVLPS